MPVSKALSWHYNDVIMSAMVSQITGASIVYSTVCSGADQRNYQGCASLAFVRGIHRWPVNSLHKGPLTRKMFPFEDVIMTTNCRSWSTNVRIPLASTTKIRMARVTSSFEMVVPQMNVIHEIGDVTTECDNFVFPKSSKRTRNKLKRNSNQSAMVFMGKML